MSQSTSAIKKVLAPNVSADNADNKALFERAFKGDVKAMYTLGRMYATGKYGLEPDEDKAFIWYQSAAALGHRDAMYNLAVLYWDSRYLPQFAELALEFFTKAANLGHGKAMFRLYELLFKGEMVVQDKKLAFEWCQKAAAHGHFEALVCFAMMCEHGEGVPQDKNKAKKLLKKAKNTRIPEDMHNLAVMLNDKKYKLQADPKTSWALLCKAAKLGHALALYSLANTYAKGETSIHLKRDFAKAHSFYERAEIAATRTGDVQVMGLVAKVYLKRRTTRFGITIIDTEPTAKDIKKGTSLMIKAASVGYKQAMFFLWTRNNQEVNQTEEQAILWLKKAAKAGQDEAAFTLAERYISGTNGTEVSQQDRAQAYFWYKKAAGKGHVDAMFAVADCYHSGRGTSKNDKMAFYWWERAALKGDVVAMYNLGNAYSRNIGTEKNKKLSCEWFKKAAVAGDKMAKHRLGMAYLEGSGVDKDEKQAFALMLEAANGSGGNGSVEAVEQLGKMYEKGIGCKKDLRQAKHCEEKVKLWKEEEKRDKEAADARKIVPGSNDTAALLRSETITLANNTVTGSNLTNNTVAGLNRNVSLKYHVSSF